jgi:hypothetical protein
MRYSDRVGAKITVDFNKSEFRIAVWNDENPSGYPHEKLILKRAHDLRMVLAVRIDPQRQQNRG